MTIWIDGDSCHRRSMAAAFAVNDLPDVDVVLVADRDVPMARDSGVEQRLVDHGSGEVDSTILSMAGLGDVAVTRDLELAMRLMDRDIRVISDHGRIWNRRDLEKRIKEAQLMNAMRAGGMVNRVKGSYDSRTARQFEENLRRLVT